LAIFSITPSPLAVHNAFPPETDAMPSRFLTQLASAKLKQIATTIAPHLAGRGIPAARRRAVIVPNLLHIDMRLFMCIPPCSQPGWAAPLRPAACLVAAMISRLCIEGLSQGAQIYYYTARGMSRLVRANFARK